MRTARFFFSRTYELNGYKSCTLPLFVKLPPNEPKYRTNAIGNDIISVEVVNEGIPKFPFEAAHCYSNEREITSSPMTIRNDPERNKEKMVILIKIIHRIRKLRPSVKTFPIYHCVFSKYRELFDDVILS